MKVAIYSRTMCSDCLEVKKILAGSDMTKVFDPDKWSDGTWVERDVADVYGVGLENWREFPDCEFLAHVMLRDIETVPVAWVDGRFYNGLEEISVALEKRREPIAVPA